MTKDRVSEILIEYIDNDLNTADPEYVRETLRDICTNEELKELGLYEWLGFEDEDD